MNLLKTAINKINVLLHLRRDEKNNFRKNIKRRYTRWQKNAKYEESQYLYLVKKRYEHVTGHSLNLDNPMRYTEKIQWRKLFDRSSIYAVLTDKIAVRNWVTKKLNGSENLIPLLGVWDRAEDIDFDGLPDKFVLKTNNGSARNIVVTDKNKLDIDFAIERLNWWLKVPFALSNDNFELHYLNIKPQILAEEYIKSDEGESDLLDYKFLCFHGKPYYFWVDFNRSSAHRRNIYDMSWNLQSWRVSYENHKWDLNTIKKFDKMLEIVNTLCAGFAHVRVDLYNNNGQVYFGEMTFTSGDGMEPFYPDEWDYKLGALWDIKAKQTDEKLIQPL